MRRLFEEVKKIVSANGLHRKGWRVNDLSLPQMFNHAHGELSEMYDAMTPPGEPEESQKCEMGDVLSCMYHMMVRKGWDPDEIEAYAIRKLRMRWEYGQGTICGAELGAGLTCQRPAELDRRCKLHWMPPSVLPC